MLTTSNKQHPPARRSAAAAQRAARRCRRKFLSYFPGGFRDATYLDTERDYKQLAHERWAAELGRRELRAFLRSRKHQHVAARAVAIEARTNLLFSFEKMALRDAVRTPEGARIFADALAEFLYGARTLERRFETWCSAVAALPRKQTRVLTWPVLTVFPFIAEPTQHMFLKPDVTRAAASAYAFDFEYGSRPAFATYASVLDFAARVRRDLRDLHPRDMIDLQSFIWVQGSAEYAD